MIYFKRHLNTLISLITVLGLSVFSIGAMAVIGYYLDNRSFYYWKSSVVAMAYPTAIGFTCTGLALLLVALYMDIKENRSCAKK